jgi:ATP-dependent DNA helicase RecG
METIGAFSNARGGTLLIGVKDSGEVIGFLIGNNTLEEMANRIQNVTDPRLQPSFTVMQHESKGVVAIQVLAKIGTLVSVRGRYFRRVAKTNQRMSHEEIMQTMIASSGLSWDAFIEASATLNDLDAERISAFIISVKKSGRRPVPDTVPDFEFLRKIKLIQDNSPTRAALLLFGKNPNHHFPSAFLKIGRFRSPTHIVDDLEAHGTLTNQLDVAMGWFRRTLSTEFAFTGHPQRDVLWEYPLNAIREALINVLCHRDYTSGAHSQIRLYDDHLKIWNSGNLPPALTPEMLLKEHDSIPRNRLIAEAFFYMGLIERWGSGTTRIADELKTAGFPDPEFESKLGRFQVVFNKQPVNISSEKTITMRNPPLKIAEENLPDQAANELGISQRQLLAIYHVKNTGSISNIEYQNLTGASKRTASRELNALKLKGIFTATGKGRGTTYQLTHP